jgi:hypothetical protein
MDSIRTDPLDHFVLDLPVESCSLLAQHHHDHSAEHQSRQATAPPRMLIRRSNQAAGGRCAVGKNDTLLGAKIKPLQSKKLLESSILTQINAQRFDGSL